MSLSVAFRSGGIGADSGELCGFERCVQETTQNQGPRGPDLFRDFQSNSQWLKN